MGQLGSDGTFKVPEGFQVAGIRVQPKANLSPTRSGVRVVDFGPEPAMGGVFNMIESFLEKDPLAPVVWVIQKEAVRYWMSDTIRTSVLLRRFRRIQQLRAMHGSFEQARPVLAVSGRGRMDDLFKPNPPVIESLLIDSACVEGAGPQSKALMNLLVMLGISVSTPADDGMVLLEVRRADGMVFIGFPGTTLPGQGLQPTDEESALSKAYHDAGSTGRSPDGQLEVDPAEAAIIEQVVEQEFRAAGRSVEKGEPLLSTLMPDFNAGKRASFMGLFAQAVVGVFESENHAFAVTRVEDDKKRLLVWADPVFYDMLFPGDFNVGLVGIDVLGAVEANPQMNGIYVKSALSAKGVIISREDALAALRA